MENRNNRSYGKLLQKRLKEEKILPLIGVYDVFSSLLASKRFEAIFCSGYGFAASYYGLPDEGFISWTDMISYVERIRAVLPQTHIVVDIDDGYGDPNIAATVTRRLERVGASAVIIEDQRRPKKCGHLPGKEILTMDEYMPRLTSVLKAREELFVIARTDTNDLEEALERAKAFCDVGVDGILIEGIKDINWLPNIKESVGNRPKVTVNLIQGGKTGPISLSELANLGVDIVNFSTPCLFAAHYAIENLFDQFIANDGKLHDNLPSITLSENNELLKKTLSNTFKY